MGHELVAVLVGDFYGLGVGFAVVGTGSVMGGVLNFL